MILFVLFTAFVLVCGMAIGATIIRDWLDKPRARKTTPRIPLARVLTRAESRRLEIPAVRRRQEIRTALGWERPAEAERSN